MNRTMSDATRDAIHACDDVARQLARTGNPYAVVYLTGARRAYADHGPRGVHAQIVYALSNLRGWRGDAARAAKLALARHAKNTRDESHKIDESVVSRNNHGAHTVYYT